MESLTNSALLLLFACAAGLIYYILLPSGKISATAKSVLSVFILLVAMQPLFSFFDVELPRFGAGENAGYADLDDYFTAQVKSEVVSVVGGIIKKYAETPCDIEVSVNISEDRSINIEQVRLIFDKNAVYDSRLEGELEAVLGLRPEIVLREEE